MTLDDGSTMSQDLQVLASHPQIPSQIDRFTAADSAKTEVDKLWDQIETAASEALQRLRDSGSPGGHRYDVVTEYAPARTWYLRHYHQRDCKPIVGWKLDSHHNGYALGEDGLIYTARDVLMDPPPRRRGGLYWSNQAWHEARAHARPTVRTLELLLESLKGL